MTLPPASQPPADAGRPGDPAGDPAGLNPDLVDLVLEALAGREEPTDEELAGLCTEPDDDEGGLARGRAR
jgi:hypothetical protein